MKYLILILILISNCGPAWEVEKEIYKGPIQSESPTEGQNPLKIVVFDVGEGNATLIIAPNDDALLIDTGPPGSGNTIINPYISNSNNISLKHFLISHPDMDHAGAAAEIALEPEILEAGQTLRLGNKVKLSVLAKDCKFANSVEVACDPKDDNANSMALLLTYEKFKYLTAGDLPGGGGTPPYDTIDLETPLSALVGDIDVLHVSHHGSNTSTNQHLLDAVRPETAIISVGNGNDYWHPHPSVIERLVSSGVEIHQTERGWLKDEYMEDVGIANGNVVIESNGETYTITP